LPILDCWIIFFKTKSAEEVLDATHRFIKDAQSETNLRMTTFLTDNGSEYVSRDMSAFLLQKNIKHQRTTPYSPQQNGMAERRNQTVMAMARCVLIESNLPYEYWPLAVRYTVYTLNRLPTKSIDWKNPYEIWIKQKPNIAHLRPFGCTAFAHIEKSLRTSLESTSTKCTFL
jgi:transposase InsO family protein